MSAQPFPSLFSGRWPKSNSAAAPFCWSRSMPIRCSIVGLAMAIAASTFARAKVQCVPPNDCEAEKLDLREEIREPPRLASRFHSLHHELPTASILASSPSSAVIHDGQPGAIYVAEQSAPSWWKRIGQTFFVIKRGIEILVRFSPLLVLTPTAVAASYIKPMWKKYAPVCLSPLTIEGSNVSHLDHQQYDEMLTKQFRDSNALALQHHRRATWASNLAWAYTLHSLQSLGPAFVKLAQWAATRRDLFPVHVCNRLSELHDTAWIHDWKYTHDALVDAFGKEYESRGLFVMKNCGRIGGRDVGILGSGSAAQVHRGTLTTRADSSRSNNNTGMRTRNVAIKILHPNTRQLVERDLDLMRHVAHFINRCIPLAAVKMLSLPRAVSNFSVAMERQVDLHIESSNLTSFRRNFGCTGYYEDSGTSPPAITFPRPEPEWVSERVLVEEYAGDDAVPISRYLADDSPEGLKVRKRLAGPLLRAFLKMVFVDNFIHADLHPGNLLVRAVPSQVNPKRANYTIIFLDAGIAISLPPNDKKNLRDLFKAVVLNDGYMAGSLMVERARYERCTSIPGGKHAFASGVSDIVSEFHDRRKQGLTLGAVRVGALLGQVLDLCRRYGVEIDPAMSSVVVSMLVLEGLGRSLDPDLNLMKAAIPFLLIRKV